MIGLTILIPLWMFAIMYPRFINYLIDRMNKRHVSCNISMKEKEKLRIIKFIGGTK